MPETAITPGEAAATHETTDADLVPPGAHTHEVSGTDALAEIARLQAYLEERFPGQVDLSNRQVPETPVDAAIRLLAGLSATVRGREVRCEEQYCNKPSGHTDNHGWVHYQ